jgi:hypothetical protein
MLLKSVPPGVTTRTSPEVAPVGTVVVIKELDAAVAPARRATLTAGQTLARTLHPLQEDREPSASATVPKERTRGKPRHTPLSS